MNRSRRLRITRVVALAICLALLLKDRKLLLDEKRIASGIIGGQEDRIQVTEYKMLCDPSESEG